MERTPLNWPRRGATNAQPYIETPDGFGPVESLRNVRPRRTGTGRLQIGQRPGLVATFAVTLDGAVQAMAVGQRSSGVSTYEVGPGTVVRQVGSVGAGPMRGQFLLLDSDWSVRATLLDARGTGIASPPFGGGAHEGNSVCWHPTDPDIGYCLTIARDTAASNQNVAIFGLSRVSLATNAFTHQTYGLDTSTPYAAGAYPAMPPTGQVDIYANKMLCTGTYVLVAARQYVYVFRADNLAFITRHALDWADEVQSIDVVTVGGTDYLIAAGEGLASIAGPVVLDGGPSRAVSFGYFYRTSLSVYAIQYGGPGKAPVAGGGVVLARRDMPQGTQSSDPGYEDHRTFRFSEYSQQRPRGCLVWDVAAGVGDAGQVYAYVARTNQGFGYDGSIATQRPDGSVAYVSACRAMLTRAFEPGAPAYIDPSAAVRYGFDAIQGGWEVDTDSLRKAFSWHGGTLLNDIPNSEFDFTKHDPHRAGESPSLFAVALDQARDRVYFGGRRPAPGQALPNIYCLRASDGTRLWATDLLGLVQQNSMAVDPTTGNVLVGANRNTGWTGSGGQPAMLWELDRWNGSVVRAFDLTDAVHKNAYVGPNNERQTVSITGSPTGGTFTLTFAGQTTAGIAYNASAATVQAALEALSNIGVGDVAVTGGPGPGTPWVVEFDGAFANANVAHMTADGSGLTGGSSPAATVSLTVQGGIVPGCYDVAVNTRSQVLLALTPAVYDQ